eukprot:gnl/TRDRNA2_/TRDRNA2_82188_c0_seq1.p1 gnl/TRDRNA2_/TRDRNA2_82188_c0~~gnl/TRDRNA2_/TRDRNA2_82188_c0_seq1.p1  ORF type:complete len:185 (+),score=18.09 gnl/TRDRNA2_/TRDRNA2_82188_c0_seq1:28-582(+)
MAVPIDLLGSAVPRSSSRKRVSFNLKADYSTGAPCPDGVNCVCGPDNSPAVGDDGQFVSAFDPQPPDSEGGFRNWGALRRSWPRPKRHPQVTLGRKPKPGPPEAAGATGAAAWHEIVKELCDMWQMLRPILIVFSLVLFGLGFWLWQEEGHVSEFVWLVGTIVGWSLAFYAASSHISKPKAPSV